MALSTAPSCCRRWGGPRLALRASPGFAPHPPMDWGPGYPSGAASNAAGHCRGRVRRSCWSKPPVRVRFRVRPGRVPYRCHCRRLPDTVTRRPGRIAPRSNQRQCVTGPGPTKWTSAPAWFMPSQRVPSSTGASRIRTRGGWNGRFRRPAPAGTPGALDRSVPVGAARHSPPHQRRRLFRGGDTLRASARGRSHPCCPRCTGLVVLTTDVGDGVSR